MKLAGKKWIEVKDILENYMTVDTDNVDETTGDCIVDFAEPYDCYSISGKIIITEDEAYTEISDEAEIYENK